jgi:hypothetical protein
VRAFIIALMFPLTVWSFKNHIPPTGILMENPVIAAGIADHEPVGAVTLFRPAGLEQDLYLDSTIKNWPGGSNQETGFNREFGNYADDTSAAVFAGDDGRYDTYSLKSYLMSDALEQWSFDALFPGSVTSQKQARNHTQFEGADYSPAFAIPRTELSMPRVTGLVIKPSM